MECLLLPKNLEGISEKVSLMISLFVFVIITSFFYSTGQYSDVVLHIFFLSFFFLLSFVYLVWFCHSFSSFSRFLDYFSPYFFHHFAEDLTSAIRVQTGITLSPLEVDIIFAAFDADSDGQLVPSEYDEFLELVADRKQRGRTVRQWLESGQEKADDIEQVGFFSFFFSFDRAWRIMVVVLVYQDGFILL